MRRNISRNNTTVGFISFFPMYREIRWILIDEERVEFACDHTITTDHISICTRKLSWSLVGTFIIRGYVLSVHSCVIYSAYKGLYCECVWSNCVVCREVANAWECRMGPPAQPAPAYIVQSLFNDIELYPTKTQGKFFMFR